MTKLLTLCGLFVYTTIAPLMAQQLDRLSPQPTLNICPSSQIMTRLELYFGASKPDGSQVGWPEWRQFMEDEVTPRFPDGLTVTTAFGQWRNPQGRIISETSRVLLILHTPSADSNGKVEAIRTAYKLRFNQTTVLRVDSFACASF